MSYTEAACIFRYLGLKNNTLKVFLGIPTAEELYHMARKNKIVYELTPDRKLRAAYYEAGPPQLSTE